MKVFDKLLGSAWCARCEKFILGSKYMAIKESIQFDAYDCWSCYLHKILKTFGTITWKYEDHSFFFFFWNLSKLWLVILQSWTNSLLLACFIVTDLPVLILGNIDSALSELIVAVRYNLISMTPNPALNQIE